MGFTRWLELKAKSVHSQWKSFDRKHNLKFLDDNLNKHYGELLVHLFGSVTKIVPSFVKAKLGKSVVEDNYIYGHVLVGMKKEPMRLSSCLSLKNNTVQFPVDEYPKLLKGKYFFFNCGDIYMVVDALKLHREMEGSNIVASQTAFRNYEISITSLFDRDLVCHFGMIDVASMTAEKENGSKVGLPRTLGGIFLNTKLRGCMSGEKPKYILARIENSDSPSFLHLIYIMKRSDVRSLLKTNIKTDAGIGAYSKFHTDNIMKEVPLINGKNLLRINKSESYVLVKNVEDIEMRLGTYCKKYIEQKPSPKNHNLHWAVKRSHYCRSEEEYIYYRDLFVACNGAKKSYTDEDILFFKNNFAHKRYRAKESDKWYKGHGKDNV